MASTEAQMERRMRIALELGRAGWASKMLLWIAPVLLAAREMGRPSALVWPVGIALALLVCGLAFVHLRYQRAAMAGIAAALPALLAPWVLRLTGGLCLAGRCFDPCLPSCLVAGALAGVWVASRAAREERPWSFCFAAWPVTAVMGTLGCSVAGWAGVLGLVAGVAAGAAPVLVRGQLRRS